MSQQFVYELARTHPVALVRPRGVLDAYSAPDLRAALLESLAAQPVALVLDFAGVMLADEVALTVLASVARDAARWPGSLIIIGGAEASTRAAIERMGVTPLVAVYSALSAALAAAEARAVPPTVRQRVDPDRYAPALAREVLAHFCRDRGITREADTAELIASELITNAVVHARTPIDFTIRLITPHLHIAVRDHDPRPARITAMLDESAEHGRGLLLVDALAAAWGTFVLPRGKVIWATVATRVLAQRDGPAVALDA